MDQQEFIGKAVVNANQEEGIIIGIDEKGRFIIKFEERTALFVNDVFEKGFLTLLDPYLNQKIKLEKINKYKLEAASEIDECINELNQLVGLSSIKERVKDLVCEINISNLREAYGLKCPEVTKHMVFMGNPGTGKTTVARIIAKIYKSLGILTKGQLVEVDRSALVAGYQGQTAIKTKEVIDKAIGGILFIDEAYALCRDKDDDFGYEALDTLTKEIEEHRNNLVVIVAGYKTEMDKFLNANPGLRSRFKTIVNFDDYYSDELYEMLKHLIESNDYSLSDEADKYIKDYFNKNKSISGNGRAIRNSFEEIIRYQARRLNDLKEVDKQLLITIETPDLVGLESVSI